MWRADAGSRAVTADPKPAPPSMDWSFGSSPETDSPRSRDDARDGLADVRPPADTVRIPDTQEK